MSLGPATFSFNLDRVFYPTSTTASSQLSDLPFFFLLSSFVRSRLVIASSSLQHIRHNGRHRLQLCPLGFSQGGSCPSMALTV